MSKTLLLAAFAGALTACTITINGSGSEGNSSSQNTSGGPGSGDTGDEPPATTTSDVPTTEPPTTASDPTTDIPTTDGTIDGTAGEPTTGEPVLTGTTGEPGTSTGSATGTDTESEGSSAADTTGGSGYGMCGWNVDKTYYACPTDGGVPGLADPKNNYLIDCRDQELAGGSPCGAVGPAGCCTPTGDLFYCGDNEMLVEENCGA